MIKVFFILIFFGISNSFAQLQVTPFPTWARVDRPDIPSKKNLDQKIRAYLDKHLDGRWFVSNQNQCHPCFDCFQDAVFVKSDRECQLQVYGFANDGQSVTPSRPLGESLKGSFYSTNLENLNEFERLINKYAKYSENSNASKGSEFLEQVYSPNKFRSDLMFWIEKTGLYLELTFPQGKLLTEQSVRDLLRALYRKRKPAFVRYLQNHWVQSDLQTFYKAGTPDELLSRVDPIFDPTLNLPLANLFRALSDLTQTKDGELIGGGYGPEEMAWIKNYQSPELMSLLQGLPAYYPIPNHCGLGISDDRQTAVIPIKTDIKDEALLEYLKTRTEKILNDPFAGDRKFIRSSVEFIRSSESHHVDALSLILDSGPSWPYADLWNEPCGVIHLTSSQSEATFAHELMHALLFPYHPIFIYASLDPNGRWVEHSIYMDQGLMTDAMNLSKLEHDLYQKFLSGFRTTLERSPTIRIWGL